MQLRSTKKEQMSPLVRLGKYISTERGFVKAWVVALGTPASAFGAWALQDYGEAASFFAIPAAFAGAYVSGLVVWRSMFRDG